MGFPTVGALDKLVNVSAVIPVFDVTRDADSLRCILLIPEKQ